MYPPERSDLHRQLEAAAVHLLRMSKRHPVPSRRLERDLARTAASYRASTLHTLLDNLVNTGTVTVLGGGLEPEYFWTDNLVYLKERLGTIVQSYHTKHPYEPGVPTGEIKKRFSDTQTLNAQRNIDARVFELAVRECKSDGLVVETESGLRLSSFTPRVRGEDSCVELEAHILRSVEHGFCCRVDEAELALRFDVDTRTVQAAVSRLVNTGRLIRLFRLYPVREFRYLCASTVDRAKSVLAAELHRRSRMSTSEIRLLLGQTRSTVIPLLEHLDRIGFTQRNGEHRRLVRAAVPISSDGGSARDDDTRTSRGETPCGPDDVHSPRD